MRWHRRISCWLEGVAFWLRSGIRWDGHTWTEDGACVDCDTQR